MEEQRTNQRVVLCGHRIREEFQCPISYELLREPVVAADGFTYERCSIETWFKSRRTSPLTGANLDSTTLIPNHTIKKLIDDLIHEGGQGLYVRDDSVNRTFELIPHKLLIMKCLGPQDSDFNERRFQVSLNGAVGGRKQPSDLESKNFVPFTDNTVSRRHFEVTHDRTLNKYFIKDLGSAGGTFVRIPHGKRHLLKPGMMLLLGKHQFSVSAVDEHPADESKFPLVDVAAADASKSAKAGSKLSGSEAIGKLLVADDKLSPIQADSARAKEVDSKLVRGITDDRSLDDDSPRDQRSSEAERASEDQVRLQRVYDSLRELLHRRQSRGDVGRMEAELADVSARIADLMVSEPESENKVAEDTGRHTPRQSEAMDDQSDATPDNASDEPTNFPAETSGAEQGYAKLRLTCFAPEQSPIQGDNYIVGIEGATIGRRSTNTIHFSHQVEERFYGIDNSISAEHARILYDEQLKGLVIVDGSAAKGSTNGTWQRLSPAQKPSEPYRLNAKMEVLIGTVRFQVNETDTLTEQTVS